MKETLTKTLLKRYTLSPLSVLERLLKTFSLAERVLFWILVVALTVGAVGLLNNVNKLFLTPVPTNGGTLSEGLVGSPRFFNPLLALSDGDRDMTSLIYSGLLRALPDQGLTPDLAESYTASEDGLSYTFVLREDAEFHDGKPVTANDVVFTILKAQDSALKSSKRANWEGVTVEKIDERTIKLVLRQPYAPFLENATMGILPKHIWESADADGFTFSPFNIEAIGSGPYKISRIKRSSSGIPYAFDLVPFKQYSLGVPYIEHLQIHFYQNEKDLLSAIRKGEVESATSITPKSAQELALEGYRIERTPLPRVFAVFFNQNQAPLLAEKGLRDALTLATDKDVLVQTVLEGYGVPIDGPIPPPLLSERVANSSSMESRLEQAGDILDRDKWKMNETTGLRERTKGKVVTPLSFTLTTSDVPELKESAELLANMWKNIGIDVKVQIFESGDLNQNVIRPRKYDALLFGEIIGHDLDLFAFWHSSQRNDPGLNIAMYTNSKVDRLLEDARRTGDENHRVEKYQDAISAIRADTPAIFLYSPEFIYVIPDKINGFKLRHVAIPSERFLGINNWYIETEKIWNFFTH
ncbi:MAG: hypothetical protein COV91_06370 [Candidatus Taylorbacteria bacterium CG11_big_fil_rev_8_21_14_0_20_46_11]|uniref:Solute-binding protein family 5 domain-containing protein n=1 Tax=Candidatus Taylorbacteria bacterium CG11_big_fil_rev_8_21_14_0_20_46_11 TaxID=1975025 RepID=A0A2H0K9W1_9BACT|nr:MAG: hypothetical protein COV91_06370 [Candidatus Taylorbacteria bacterium CG11_big_fil_rev_8_21_14_0_20_46_11]